MVGYSCRSIAAVKSKFVQFPQIRAERVLMRAKIRYSLVQRFHAERSIQRTQQYVLLPKLVLPDLTNLQHKATEDRPDDGLLSVALIFCNDLESFTFSFAELNPKLFQTTPCLDSESVFAHTKSLGNFLIREIFQISERQEFPARRIQFFQSSAEARRHFRALHLFDPVDRYRIRFR